MAIQLVPLHFDKVEMDLVPENHRLAYFGMAQIANETAILLRIAISAINSMAEPQPVRDMSNATAMFATRMLAGRLWEARQFVNSQQVALSFHELRALAVAREKDSDPAYAKAARSRARLFDILDRSPIIGPLRNRAAFHTDFAFIAEAYAHLPADIQFVDHLGHSRGNSIYGAAESLHLTALTALSGQPDHEAALARAVSEIGDAVGCLNDFIEGFIMAFVITYFGVDRMRSEQIEVPATPIDEITAPLFSEASRTSV